MSRLITREVNFVTKLNYTQTENRLQYRELVQHKQLKYLCTCWINFASAYVFTLLLNNK